MTRRRAYRLRTRYNRRRRYALQRFGIRVASWTRMGAA